MGRAAIVAALAASLAACGGDENSTSGPIRSGGTAADCSLSARQDWAKSQLEDWYRFPDLLDLSVDKSNYNSVQAYLDALTAPGDDVFDPDNIGKTFTYITSIKEENDLIANGSSAGFGIRLVYDRGANRVYVAEAFETAPAFKAGIDRGTEILQIDGQSVFNLMANGGPAAVSQALGPSDPGVTRNFVFRSTSGVEQSASVSKTDYSLDPVSDRYGVKVLDDGAGGKVGYINLRTFIVQNANDQLRTAFAEFRAQGIANIILDLRYNGGGLVNVADTLGDLMGQGLVGQVFSNTTYRSSKSSRNSTRLFEQEAQQITVMKLAVIGRLGTASASELVANSMIPYLNENIALIGADTYGKPVGQDAFDRSACDDRLRAVTFQTVNANGDGEYFGGLSSVMPNTCRANDDIFTQLGEPGEQSVAVALDFLAGRTCTPIGGGAKGVSVMTLAPARRLLESPTPSAAQREMPGLY